MLPPFMSAVATVVVPVAVSAVNVPAAAVEAPIIVPSILPPFTSAVVTVVVPVGSKVSKCSCTC
jgi:hypothetical protein